jgi:hypothetical protein
MNYEIVADVLMIVHASLIVLIFLGILLSIKVRWFRPVESLILLTAVVTWSIYGGCPLTLAENYLRLQTTHPIPLAQVGFIPYYVRQWFGLEISNFTFIALTYAVALMFLVLDVSYAARTRS